jgi:hypothetical protein
MAAIAEAIGLREVGPQRPRTWRVYLAPPELRVADEFAFAVLPPQGAVSSALQAFDSVALFLGRERNP